MSVVFLLQLLTEAKAKAAMDLGAAQEPQPKKTRVRQIKTFTDPTSGVVVPMTARHSLWWILYIQDPKVDCPQWNKVFRKQFRLPYQSFLDLLAMIKKDGEHCDFFERWHEERPDKQFRKIKASPIELLLLGSLRYLGRGWTFDALEESAFITRRFIEFFTSLLNLDPKFYINVRLCAFNIGRAQGLRI
ncbi:Plant transposon protein [Fragilaria crotonensis]|nr:Plant transposon protein [Fragilaria crotonensis]